MPCVSDSRVTLAVRAVRHYLATGSILSCPEDLPDELKIQAGAFVSIKKHKRLRGCIGSILPQSNRLAEEIIQNAISAATRDPRFPPIRPQELPELDFSVDVLTQPEKIKSKSALDCKRYGIIIKNREKQGVLLPNLEGIESVEEQIRICRKKAGLKPDDPIDIYRFESKRYTQ